MLPRREPSELDMLARRFPELTGPEDLELVALWAAVGLEMKRRGLIRGLGSVPGELAETLIAQWYGAQLRPQATPDVDLVTPKGRSVQVKALRFTKPDRGSVGAFRRPIAFDELAIVCFEFDMSIREVLLVDASLLRVSTDEQPGLLTPKEKRLSLGPRLFKASERISSEDIRTPGAGSIRDDRRAASP